MFYIKNIVYNLFWSSIIIGIPILSGVNISKVLSLEYSTILGFLTFFGLIVIALTICLAISTERNLFIFAKSKYEDSVKTIFNRKVIKFENRKYALYLLKKQ